MIRVYARLVKAGAKNIEDVPENIREQVREEVEKL